ncbi:NADP-dependent methylenetetrahydromethanopterin/methylenetetrahydrofolate dehydrogenase [Sporomusa sphaeroides]|uniref:NADP-dependent methylenetetrahydromethanopterin/methylenetetrahydrofolate dehydrogenase n=1 Tax=Sporomusa sphaeroides TaxID=47679 RepID=UPI00202F1C26|nr:NADP-dependent methylenetetrahydromethanopterin/methylenetetrahydrofolate dehydrogenase [Sporomusa sphaeroides]MCM0759192.1 NADP-dependent methylenetetrahydromethanopterin/methylenetetrahydrofolate dehydrogenase [Sporomusa sphaeroides DSM 2875]HML35274.1 NADP-dependent methylenetetrahydromethanopterin/methylenetetrahydrofolate dehydrogenase [Sporomusa sphaeroides]
MKKILVQLDTDPKASVFDQVTAYDAGADHIIAYGGITTENVTNLVHGAMFTRGGEKLRNTAIFIGGTQVEPAEEIMKQVLATFFGPVRVSVMFDANGCNTTAAALVHKIARGRVLAGKKALVLAGTGPVGMRVAKLLDMEGCQVLLSSRQSGRALAACRYLQAETKLRIEPAQVANALDLKEILSTGVNIIACCGAAGVQLLDQQIWSNCSSLEIIADINAVTPLGVEGIAVTDDGKERQGKTVYGAIAIGNLKMQIHRAAIQALFAANDRVVDVEAIYDLAQKTGK